MGAPPTPLPPHDDVDGDCGADDGSSVCARRRKGRSMGEKMTRSQVSALSDPKKLCLVILHDKVYDLTRWQHSHPGGALTIRALSGKDGTDAFDQMHPEFVKKRLGSFFHSELASSVCNIEDEATLAFRQLTNDIHDAGLFETHYSYYVEKACVFVAIFATMLMFAFGSDHFFLHCIAGVLLGLFWQQMAFVGHDLGHNAITHDREMDGWLGLLAGNFLTGISIGWWKRSHNVHHIVTNSCEHDPDIQHLPVFAVNSSFLKSETYSTFYDRLLPLGTIAHLLVRYQHVLYYPIMSVARFNLYVQSITHALGVGDYNTGEYIWRKNWQIASLVGFWVWLLGLTALLPTLESRAAFFLLAHMTAGILHVQITLSHFCMPSYNGRTYDDSTNGFLRTQLETSMDIECPTWMDWFHGGLQFQVEHHLWPRLPRHNVRKVKPMLQSLCKEHDLPYHQDPFLKANLLMLGYLRETAKECKAVSELFIGSWNMEG